MGDTSICTPAENFKSSSTTKPSIRLPDWSSPPSLGSGFTGQCLAAWGRRGTLHVLNLRRTLRCLRYHMLAAISGYKITGDV